MTWIDNTRETIKLTSPNGDVFEALWKGNERTFEIKLGRFDMPKFKGTIVQDLSPKSVEYPLTVFFEGPDHDEQAEDFFTALYDQRGQWSIVHPTKGTKALQLVSFSEAIQPVENGNYTEIQTQWIEPANIDILLSEEELSTAITDSIVVVNQDFLSTLAKLRTDTFAAVQSTINTFQKYAGLGKKILSEIAKTVAVIEDAFNAAYSALIDAIAQYDITNTDPGTLGAQLQQLLIIPVGASTEFSTRVFYYNNLITESQSLFPDTTTEDDINISLAAEFSILSTLVVISDIVITSEFQSRVDVITAMRVAADLFNNTIIALDELQDNFRDKNIDGQYFANIDSYTNLMLIFAQTQRYLISQFYNLKAEKRFTLKTERSPLEITVTEYGELGENDSNYDLFLASNNLYGKEIVLLPAGTEVVVYV